MIETSILPHICSVCRNNLKNWVLAIFVFLISHSAMLFSSQLSHGDLKPSSDGIKVLILIAASDELPIYREAYKIWRAYMHLDPDHVEAYFIKADPNMSAECQIEEDVIFCRTPGAISPGVLNKTILSLESIFSKNSHFDYVVRTTLTSFYVLPRLLDFLSTLPRSNCYCGVRLRYSILGHPVYFASGSGFILSADIAKLLVDNKSILMDDEILCDDVSIGLFLSKKGVPLLSAPRMDFMDIDSWFQYEEMIPSTEFHFRCTNPNLELRMTDELYMMLDLLKKFYGVPLGSKINFLGYDYRKWYRKIEFERVIDDYYGID